MDVAFNGGGTKVIALTLIRHAREVMLSRFPRSVSRNSAFPPAKDPAKLKGIPKIMHGQKSIRTITVNFTTAIVIKYENA